MPPPTPRLRAEQLALARRAAGLTSLDKLARAMGLHRSSIHRILRGQTPVSAAFIGGCRRAFPACTYDDLFADAPDVDEAIAS